MPAEQPKSTMGVENKEDVEYQLGTHSMDTSGSIVEDDDVIEFEVETEAVFRRLADDIYESPEAGIREPLTNAITTVRRAFEGREEDGMIEITVQDGDQVMLRLRDTGEGISKSVLKKVLTVIGRSNAIDDGKLSGQYGMGFLASYKLVGLNGGFLMCTNPRNSSEGPYSGLFKPGTFEPDKNNSLPQLLEDDQYGTVFEYYVKDGISVSDIRDWVEKHARWSTVPVRYVEIDEDGNERYNEDYHAPELGWRYEQPSITVGNDYYEASMSPDAENDIVLISSPVSMYGTRNLRKGLPWEVDLRLKYENGIIFQGPNEGMIPVEDAQYEDMSDKRKQSYIPESRVSDNDMKLPESTGTREKLRRHKEFLQHINSQLKEEYFDVVQDTLDSFEPKKMSMQDMDMMGRNVMLRIFKEFDDTNTEYTESDVRKVLDRDYEYSSPDDDLVEFIRTLTQNVKIVSESKTRKNRYPKRHAYKLLDSDHTVYMCVSTSSWKADAVGASEDDTHIIQVNKSDDYEPFREHLDWNVLKTIKKSNATDKLQISEDELEDLTTSRDSESSQKEMTIHYDSGGRDTIKRTVQKTKEMFDGSVANSRAGDVLLLYPRSSDQNVSNNYDLAEDRCSVASCGRKVVDELTEADGIVTYDNYDDWVLEKEIATSEGCMSVQEFVKRGSPKAFYVKKHTDGLVSDPNILGAIGDESTSMSRDPLTGLVDKNLWSHITDIESDINICNEVVTLRDKNIRSLGYIGSSIRVDPVKSYLRSIVPDEIQRTMEFSTLESGNSQITKDLISLAKALRDSYEERGELASNEQIDNEVKLPRHTTKNGRMTIEEVYEEYQPSGVVVHVLSEDRISRFEKDVFLENSHIVMNVDRVTEYELPNKRSQNSIYVPVTKSEFKIIDDHIKKGTTVLGKRDYNRRRTHSTKAKTVYASTILCRWDADTISNICSSSNFNSVASTVETMKTIHDRGYRPSDTSEKEIQKFIRN